MDISKLNSTYDIDVPKRKQTKPVNYNKIKKSESTEHIEQIQKSVEEIRKASEEQQVMMSKTVEKAKFAVADREEQEKITQEKRLEKAFDSSVNQEIIASSQETAETVEKTKAILEKIAPRALSLSFKVNEELGRTTISVTDAKSDEVVREIPSEEYIRMITSIRKYQQRVNDANATLDPNSFHAKGSSNKENNNAKGIILDSLA